MRRDKNLYLILIKISTMNNKVLLTLIKTLSEVDNDQRTILLSHLDGQSCNKIVTLIARVLRKKTNRKDQHELRQILEKDKNVV